MNVRRKGNEGERDAAKALCDAAGLSPWRKHIQTTRDIAGGNQQQRAGDLLPVSEEAQRLLAPFSVIEVKTVGPRIFSFEQVMRFGAVLPASSAFAGWVDKCRGDDESTVELILYRGPRMPWYAIASCFAWKGTDRTMRFQVWLDKERLETFGVWRLDRLVEVLRG